MSVSPLPPSIPISNKNFHQGLVQEIPVKSNKGEESQHNSVSNNLQLNVNLSIVINQYGSGHSVDEKSLLQDPIGNALNLAYQAALDEINNQLENEFGPDSLQKSYDAGLDVSPEATADRIVSISLGFFGAFQTQNQDEQGREQAEHFISVLRKGVDQGFSEAREILDALKVLDGNIAVDIDKTFELVQEGYDKFLANF